MPFVSKMTDDQIIDSLRSTYGSEFTAADIRGYCAANDITYQTVTKRLEQFKVGRGKWNLEVTQRVVEEIEKSFAAPSVEPKLEQNLIQKQMIPSSALVLLAILRPFSKPVCSILRLSRVFLGMEKPLESSKPVLNSSEN